MARTSVSIDTTAFQTGIGPTFMELRVESRDYAKERAHRIADVARVLAPVLTEPDPRYYPGQLRDSIHVVSTGTDEWEIVVGEDYGGFQEFGTARMKASPYLRPAIALIEAESR